MESRLSVKESSPSSLLTFSSKSLYFLVVAATVAGFSCANQTDAGANSSKIDPEVADVASSAGEVSYYFCYGYGDVQEDGKTIQEAFADYLSRQQPGSRDDIVAYLENPWVVPRERPDGLLPLSDNPEDRLSKTFSGDLTSSSSSEALSHTDSVCRNRGGIYRGVVHFTPYADTKTGLAEYQFDAL